MEIRYNADFTVEVESAARSWITFVKTKALTNGILEFQFAANEGEQRIGLFGPQTAKAAEEHGLRIDAKGPTPELPSMASVLQKFLNDQK